jgi:hypothetical protein
MGNKYAMTGFNYPFTCAEGYKQTRFLLPALFWLGYFMIKYDGVDFAKRR